MTESEEHKALEEMWKKVREWIRAQPHFSSTKEFKLHDTYHWTKLEVYPDGDCAMLTGSWGNPGEWMPTLLIGDELFKFNGCCGGMSWYGDKKDLDAARTGDRAKTAVEYYSDFRDCFDGYSGYSLMRALYDHWSFFKSLILGEIEADNGLKNFKA